MSKRPLSLTRRSALAGLAALPTLGVIPAFAQEGRVLDDVVMGDANASVTVIEYASFTCPHCAAFHAVTWPKFKENYIDTGKVKFIMREVYFDPYGLWASMVARCGGESVFYPIVDQLLKKQNTWTRAGDIAAEIQKIGQLNGLSGSQMHACLTDRPYAEKLVERYQTNAQEHGIQSTPSFIINGDLHSGNMAYEEFAALIDRYL